MAKNSKPLNYDWKESYTEDKVLDRDIKKSWTKTLYGPKNGQNDSKVNKTTQSQE